MGILLSKPLPRTRTPKNRLQPSDLGRSRYALGQTHLAILATSPMASFYQGSVQQFLAHTDDHVLSHLATAYANRGYTSQYSDQTLTWERDLRALRTVLEHCVAAAITACDWGLLLEFSIPRKELRIDAVILISESIVLLEAKTGSAAAQAKRQIEEYALLLHYFHKASDQRRILPILVSPESGSSNRLKMNQQELFPQLSSYWIAPVIWSSWAGLPSLLLETAKHAQAQINPADWDGAAYFPVPSIIEAATALRTGLSIREIAHSEASEHEIEAVCQTVQSFVDRARTESHHAICFLTGVPGSGKTLVGLSLAHSAENKSSAIHFMSGNGPLVKVLQHLFTQESRRAGAPSPQAKTEARTLIENVHVFARYHTEDNPGAPSNHAIIFDESPASVEPRPEYEEVQTRLLRTRDAPKHHGAASGLGGCDCTRRRRAGDQRWRSRS